MFLLKNVYNTNIINIDSKFIIIKIYIKTKFRQMFIIHLKSAKIVNKIKNNEYIKFREIDGRD